MMKGKLIVFEGPEGSGKTTQAKRLFELTGNMRKKTILLREPGGTDISEQIRAIILSVKSRKLSSRAELLLYEASRCQVIEEKVIPALKKGTTVILDRFCLSTLAYQGYGRGLDKTVIKRLNHFASSGITPDITIVCDVSYPVARARIKKRGQKDRIELERRLFHENVRRGYISEASRTERCVIIKTDGLSEQRVFERVIDALRRRKILRWP